MNGQPVRGMTALRDKDLIQILDFQMFYTNGYIYYRSATSGISLYAKNINKIVGRGKKKKKILNNVDCRELLNYRGLSGRQFAVCKEQELKAGKIDSEGMYCTY